MADHTIPRDVGEPHVRQDGTPYADPFDDPEYLEFQCPPDSRKIFEDLRDQVPGSRAMRLFRPELVQGFDIDPIPPDDENPPAVELLDFLPIPDRVAPTRGPGDPQIDHRGLHNRLLDVPGIEGGIEVWSFRDNFTGNDDWPAPTIRIKEGEVIHSTMSNRRGPHTIHHHGIEPTPVNDGVGHITFDVGGGIVYNYQMHCREAGTFFYHCHVNTTLHFEMGMYGMLIVDPDVPGAPFTDGGPGATYLGNSIIPYQVEAIWVADDIERRWHANADHGFGEDAGIVCGEFQPFGPMNNPNPWLHFFNPDVFVISGSPPENRGAVGARQDILATTTEVRRGQKLLVRALNASYTTTRWRFPSELNGTVTAVDGRSLGRSLKNQYSSPFSLASINHSFHLSTAQRWDVLIDTTGAPLGVHAVDIDFHNWITDEIFDYGRLRTFIRVIV
jgi:hypothetical protein